MQVDIALDSGKSKNPCKSMTYKGFKRSGRDSNPRPHA